MGIRLKIGIGFVILIVVVTSIISYWGARTLGFSIESSDLGKLQALRKSVADSWERQRGALASLTSGIAQSLAGLDFSEAGFETTISVVERMKHHLEIDWIDILREGKPRLNPSIALNVDPDHPVPWPVRLTSQGPLSQSGFLVDYARIPESRDIVVLARKPLPVDIPLLCLWDSSGVLAGDSGSFPMAGLIAYQHSTATMQRVQKGKLFRVRTQPLETGGPFLLVGYEADAVNLSPTGVNELMLRVALLEVVGLLILGFFVGHRLFQPLAELQNAIERVAVGKWQEIPVDKGLFEDPEDELGRVARSFNRMVRELAAAQGRLIQVQRELLVKEKMAALGRFSAGVAHEINNPLGTILVSAGMVKEAAQGGKTVELEDLEAIIDETKRCRQIVESLLNYAHNRPPVLSSRELPGLMAETLEIIEGQDGGKAVPLEFSPIPTVRVFVDPLGFCQVIRNLVANSRDAVEGLAGPRIRLSAEDGIDQTVVVSVSDNGGGFAEVEDTLFEPLVTTKSKGTGLGLAICQSIVEGHGGRIWAERSQDGWTHFRFTLRKG